MAFGRILGPCVVEGTWGRERSSIDSHTPIPSFPHRGGRSYLFCVHFRIHRRLPPARIATLLSYERDKALGRAVQFAAQIMMLLEDPPGVPPGANHGEPDRRASSKRPPAKAIGGRIVDP